MNTAPSLAFAESEFRKASKSRPDKDCVRVARRDGWVELRDDKTVFGAPDDDRLVFTAEEFDAFLAGVREGCTEGLCLEINRRDTDGMYVFRRRGWAAVELVFTEAELLAFQDGVTNHEFDAIAYTA
ncbi:DUF397 domain-containing protein [Saccharopolyspora spinosa]|uniref:Uncharacterized protein DUF397 n=1 Tax=Saccharopolyspora spinosa TaxID=60894 RepID=A0A2N3Y542_SACSN|nr:DUF397 domain-containing protein [Saccharopolyspora spinosa]PKW18038.1 uncharacterized protein DUF397 [Saccharopolyspora spinosa]